MKKFEFTLKFNLQGTLLNPNDHVDALYASGCDDALVGVGHEGSIALDFIREAQSATEALGSAILNVKSAIPEAKLIEATPDLVGLTDVAEVLGCSRQNIRQMMNRHIGSFPPPVHAGKTAIWHLSPILDWVRADEKYLVDETFAELAAMTMKVNVAKEAAAFSDDLPNMLTLVS